MQSLCFSVDSRNGVWHRSRNRSTVEQLRLAWLGGDDTKLSRAAECKKNVPRASRSNHVATSASADNGDGNGQATGLASRGTYRSGNGSLAVIDRVVTGGTLGFGGATEPLVIKPLRHEKRIVLVRHGLSIWNEEGRVQGSSDLSLLSEKGKAQAAKCRASLSDIHFDHCFASPISRAKTSAELIWSGREEPLVYLDSLREANLNILEGMKNEDARRLHPQLFTAWREDPANFQVDGVFPVVDLWNNARSAWADILEAQGETVLVVTHKSLLRAMMCTAMGMGPDRFRAIDVNNGGISVFIVNKRGEPMLESLNMTAHLQVDGVRYHI